VKYHQLRYLALRAAGLRQRPAVTACAPCSGAHADPEPPYLSFSTRSYRFMTDVNDMQSVYQNEKNESYLEASS
jgi:hypothetical protein